MFFERFAFGAGNGGKNKKKSQKSLRLRRLQIESLESRELLSVNPLLATNMENAPVVLLDGDFAAIQANAASSLTVAEFATIQSQYADLNISPEMDKYNIIEVGVANPDNVSTFAFSEAGLRAAIAKAGTTAEDDLIVVRTGNTMDTNTITLSGTQLAININAETHGSVAIVSLGTNNLTLDANEQSRVLYITNSDVALAGLTITGGEVSGSTIYGGGIYNDNSTLVVTNCIIEGNSIAASGSSIYAGGCGIYGYNSTITVTDSVVTGNELTLLGTLSSFSTRGAGIYIRGSNSSLTIADSTVSNNVGGHGSGINCEGVLVVTNCAIVGNSPLSVYGSTSVTVDGGAIYSGKGGSITNSVIIGNSVSISGSAYGGGIYLNSGTLTVTNCTIAGNSISAGTARGGGIYLGGGTLNLYNTIVAENFANTSSSDIYRSSGTLSGSGNLIGNGTGQSSLTDGVNDNIVGVNPMFIDASTGDYRLASDSQAIDKGNNQYAFAAGLDANSLDMAKMPRFQGMAIDIGAYESSESDQQASILKYNISTPSLMGNSAQETIYIEVTNSGNVAAAAPLLLLDATQNGQIGARLVVGGYTFAQLDNAYAMETYPEGFGTSVTVLATGKGEHGQIESGEIVRIPVTYIGWQKPWNTTANYDFTLTALEADNTAPMDFTELKTQLKPDDISDAAWNTIWTNFTSLIGGDQTWGDYVKMLQGVAGYLADLGQITYDVGSLLDIAMGWANDAYNPLAVPVVSTDAAIAGKGFVLDFSRSFDTTTFSSRDQSSALGFGWDHNWNWQLQREENGDLTLLGPHGVKQTFQQDGRITNIGEFITILGPVVKVIPGAATTSEYSLTLQDGTTLTFGENLALKLIEDTNGNKITVTTDSQKRITKLTTDDGQTMSFVYEDGLLTSVTIKSTEGGEYITRYDYTANQLIKVTYADGNSISYSYNATGTTALLRNTLKEIVYTDDSKTIYTYGSNGRLIGGYSQDKNGTRTDEIRALSGTTSATMLVYEYSTGGKIYQTVSYNEKGQALESIARSPDGSDITTTYIYDEYGRIIAFSDTTGWTAKLEYDANGDISKVTNAQNQTLQFTYDPQYGNVTSIKDAKGNTTKFEYDTKGNPVRTVRADGTSSRLVINDDGSIREAYNRRGQQTSFTYSATGQLQSMIRPDGTTSYQYDKWGNVTRITQGTEITSYTYSSDGLYLERIDDPSGRYIAYTYDKTLGVKTRITAGHKNGTVDVKDYDVSYTYNAFGLLETARDEMTGQTERYEYNLQAGLLTKETHGNGTYTVYEYFNTARIPIEFGVLKARTDYAADGTILAKAEYTYNNVGLVQSYVSLDGTWTYEYDSLGQLTKANFASTNTAKVGHQTLVYSYDTLGNRTSVTTNGVTVQYVTNNMNQITDDGEFTYKYDADGNQTEKKKKSNGQTWTYEYDVAGRLTKQTDADGTVYEFLYDALGNRCAMIKNGVRTDFLVDPSGLGNVLMEYDATGTKTVGYVYGNGLVSETIASGTYYYGYDALGSTTILTDSTGVVKNRYAYDPYGNVLTAASSATVANSYQYVGQYGVQNNGTGQLFMRARNYDPKTGRFTTEDPIGLDAGDVNLYRYCGNNPVNAIDPSGEECGCLAWRAIGVISDLGFSAYSFSVTSGAFMAAQGKVANFSYSKFNPLSRKLYGGIRGINAHSRMLMGAARAAAAYAAYTAYGMGSTLGQKFEDFAVSQGYMKDANRTFTGGLAGDAGRLITRYTNNPAWEAAGKGLDFAISPGNLFSKLIKPGVKAAIEFSNPCACEPCTCLPDLVAKATVRQSLPKDPNRIIGPSGSGEAGYITTSPETVFPYTVEFQNNPGASSPAHEVLITFDLDDNLDWNTFELTGLTAGSLKIPIVAGQMSYSVDTMSDNRGMPGIKKVPIVLNVTVVRNGKQVKVTFAATYPDGSAVSVTDGFLGIGASGTVSYAIKPKAGLANGTEIRAVADIQFDRGETFKTNLKKPSDPNSGRDPNREALVTISNEPLGQPTNVLATATSASSVKLTWQSGDQWGRDTRFLIERWNAAKNAFEKVTETSSRSGFTVYGLAPETSYRYRITAINPIMEIQSSSVIFNDVTTPAKTVAVPATPTGLKISSQTASSVTLAWNAGGSSVSSYVLQYSTNQTDWTDIALGNVVGHTHSDLLPNTTYYYRLFAMNSAGVSAGAAEVSVQLKQAPATPTNPAVQVVDATTLFISWDAMPQTTHYTLQYSTNGTTWVSVTSQQMTENYFRHTGLTSNTTYYYRVSGNNQAGTSGFSTTVNETPREIISVVVTTNLDVVDANDGVISLREAIAYAGTGDWGTTITFAASMQGKTITLGGSELYIDKDIIINGTGRNITVDGNQKSRVFNIAAGTTVAIAGLTITNGHAGEGSSSDESGRGGGIFNNGTTTITNCVITRNTTYDRGGGGICNLSGDLTITNCTVAENTASGGAGVFNVTGTLTVTNCDILNNTSNSAGGGIASDYGTMTITNCNISGNTAKSNGGGVATYLATATIINSTISNNSVRGFLFQIGGGISCGGTMTITNCTIANNFAQGGGGGIFGSANITVRNSIIALNTTDAGTKNISTDTVASAFTYVSYSLIDDTATPNGGKAFVDQGNNLLDVSPNFVDVAAGDYRLTAGSVAVNKGDNTLAVDAEGNSLQYDRDGNARRYNNGIVDIGAYEYQGEPVLLLDPPANLRLVAAAQTTLSLDWNSVDGATEHILQRKGPGETGFTQVYRGAASKYVDRGLTAGTGYEYRVQAVGSAFSDVLSVSTAPAWVDGQDVTDSPMILSAEYDASNNRNTITWTDLGTDYVYTIYKSGRIVVNAGTEAFYVDTNPAAAGTDGYTILAYNTRLRQYSTVLTTVLHSTAPVVEITGVEFQANGSTKLLWDAQPGMLYMVMQSGRAVSGTGYLETGEWIDTNPDDSKEYLLVAFYQDSTGAWQSTFSNLFSAKRPMQNTLIAYDEFWSEYGELEEIELFV